MNSSFMVRYRDVLQGVEGALFFIIMEAGVFHSPLPLSQKLRKDRVVMSPLQKAQNPGAVLSVSLCWSGLKWVG